MENGDVAVMVINWRATGAADYEIDFGRVGLAPGPNHAVHVRDVWAKKDLGVQTGYHFTVPYIEAHGT